MLYNENKVLTGSIYLFYNTGTVNWSLLPINEDVNLLSAPECPELKSDQCDQDHDR